MNLGKNINIKANECFQLLIMTLLVNMLISCSNVSGLKKMPYNGVAVEQFNNYLKLFDELPDTDTICLDCQYFKLNVNDTAIQIGKKQYCQFSGNFIPFFKTFPLYKIQYPEGYLTLLFHYYDATYALVMYLEAISYNLQGVITSHEMFPAWVGYGYDTNNNASFNLTRYSLIYSWCEHSCDNITTTKNVTIHFNQQDGILEYNK